MKKTLSLNEIPCKNKKEIVSKEIDGATALIHLRKKSIDMWPVAYLLEDVSLDIWKLINGKRTNKDIICRLSSLYKKKENKIKRYAADIIKRLEKYGLVYFKK